MRHSERQVVSNLRRRRWYEKVLKWVGIGFAALLVVAVVGAWAMFGTFVKAARSIEKLEDGLYPMEFAGDYGFDAPDAAANIPSVLTLPILDEINETVTVGTAGSSPMAIQAAVKLLDWGMNTGLGTDEIEEDTSTWLSQQDDLTDSLQKLSLVDEAYRLLPGDSARELLDTAGCADTEITWDSDPVESVEDIMRAAGL